MQTCEDQCCEDCKSSLEKMETTLKYIVKNGLTKHAYLMIERALSKNSSEMS